MGKAERKMEVRKLSTKRGLRGRRRWGGHPKRRKEARKKGQNRYFNIVRTRDGQIKVTMRCYHQSAKIVKKKDCSRYQVLMRCSTRDSVRGKWA